MPTPLAICIEDLDAADDDGRFTSCTVLDGSQPGLTLGADGELRWQSGREPAVEFFVSLDERLILMRPHGAGPVSVHRGGRSLDVPEGKPVVLIHQDSFQLGARRFLIHVHGEAPAIVPPTPVVLEPEEEEKGGSMGRAAKAAAGILALGAAVGISACKTVEVREKPPKVAPAQVDKGPATPDAGPDTRPSPDTRAHQPKPIEVRPRPPVVAPPPDVKLKQPIPPPAKMKDSEKK